VLVKRATLHRHVIPDGGNRLVEPGGAVDDEEFRLPQATPSEIVEDGAPSFSTLAAHVLDREQHLLAISPHPKHDQEGDGGRLAVEPHPHHRAVENERTIGSSANDRAFQASQSAFTLRQVRLTVSLPTVPPNSAVRARRTRRVLVPAR
jgi:hypothetical protein